MAKLFSVRPSKKSILQYLGSALIGFTLILVVTTSPEIALPFALIGLLMPYVRKKRVERKRMLEFSNLWPEILDLIISGVESGLSLPMSISALAHRGPIQTRYDFAQFEVQLRSGTPFPLALKAIKDSFAHSTADQVCEVIASSHNSGSRDTALTLRTLADFVSADIAVRAEIEAKQSWVKNSATLAAIAPWILLIFLANQPSTIRAYSTLGGASILVIGALLTIVAYLWMNSVSKLPTQPRIFMQ
jgi:tight adherence protein B